MSILNKQEPQACPLPESLSAAIKKIYEPAGLQITTVPQRETESAGYGACRFGINNLNVVFRVAKTTPSKIGQFVTLWKRLKPSAPIQPLDVSDNINFVVVSVSDADKRGQFIFNQEILIKMNIMSSPTQKGKLAIRIYPPWTKPTAKAAIKAQNWQLQYFLLEDESNTVLASKLFMQAPIKLKW